MKSTPPPGDPPSSPDGASADVRVLFELLLNEEQARALAVFDRLRRSRPDIDLAEYLNEQDHEDCLFLLAEAYHTASRHGEALRHYEEVLKLQDAGCPAWLLEQLQERVRELRREGPAGR